VADQNGFWPIADELAKLHDVTIDYAVRIQTAAAAKQEKTAEGPISHAALFTLHRIAIVTHRSIRSLCETGWTQVTPTLIRTLLDVLASCYVIVTKQEDAEYMAFKFMCSYLIQAIGDADTAEQLRKQNQQQLEKMRQQLKGPDIKRVDHFIAKFKPQPYWFCPEFSSPGKIFKEAIPRLFDMYRQFSGAVHGSFVGSVLFSDSPDAPSINPQENPVRTSSAIVSSSRLLLDISWARGTFDGVASEGEYKGIVRAYILPQKSKVEARLPVQS
jgi:Family of unknown function (DUF5677)